MGPFAEAGEAWELVKRTCGDSPTSSVPVDFGILGALFFHKGKMLVMMWAVFPG